MPTREISVRSVSITPEEIGVDALAFCLRLIRTWLLILLSPCSISLQRLNLYSVQDGSSNILLWSFSNDTFTRWALYLVHGRWRILQRWEIHRRNQSLYLGNVGNRFLYWFERHWRWLVSRDETECCQSSNRENDRVSRSLVRETESSWGGENSRVEGGRSDHVSKASSSHSLLAYEDQFS